MPRPIILGVVGDSAAGKTTMTRGLVRILGEDQVTAVSTDDYHRYDRRQRAERGITPLHPDCNYVDIMSQHLRHLRRGEPILKPVYVHPDGTFGPPVYVDPKPFTIVEGLLGYYSEAMLDSYDVRVYLAPPEELRRRWKVRRDTSRRGYTTDQVLIELDRANPTRRRSSAPKSATRTSSSRSARGRRRPDSLDASSAAQQPPHPDLSLVVNGDGERGITITEREAERRLHRRRHRARAGRRDRGDDLGALHFASHLRTERLGEFTIGTDLHRSESLAIVQLLILYHLVTARAADALGGLGPRADAGDTAERRLRRSRDTVPARNVTADRLADAARELVPAPQDHSP